MRIGMVLDRVFPPDIRVEKEIGALSEAGHEVFLLALAREPGASAQDIDFAGATICRVSPQSFIARAINSILFQRTFRNRYWSSALHRFVKEHRLQALHVHDLPLSGTTFDIARQHKIPCVVDLHENYPALMQIWNEQSRGIARWLTGRYDQWRTYEADVVPMMDAVIVVAEESRDRLIEMGVAPERISIVMNAEDAIRLNARRRPAAVPAELHDHFVISYIGGSGRHRGLDIAIDAMSHLKAEREDVILMIAGLNAQSQTAAEEQIARLGLKDHVRLFSWIPFGEVPAYIEVSDVCLVPHRKNPQTESGAPHKLFQYMLLGKPVIVSDCAPLKRIVESTECGLVFTSGDPVALAHQMQKLIHDPELCAAMGARGREAASGPYSWSHEAKTLCALYDNLAPLP